LALNFLIFLYYVYLIFLECFIHSKYL